MLNKPDRPPPPAPSSLVRFARRCLPRFPVEIVFDVGANVGQSTAAFLAGFEPAAVYAFEPVSATFETLRASVGGDGRVHAFNLALGRSPGTARMRIGNKSVSSRIVDRPAFINPARVATVQMTSGDVFCAERHIDRIDLLKIDTEGHDLDVLLGFRAMLAQMRIGLVEVEVGLNRANRRHVPFEAIRAFLDPLDYHFFHMYELRMDMRFSGLPILRRANAVFISGALAEAHRQGKHDRSG